MRTIRFYSNAQGQTWLSPTRLMAAVCSREPIRFIDHTTAIHPTFKTAFDGAIKYLRKLVSVALWQRLFGLMMITGVLGVLRYPVVMGKLPSPIPETVFGLVAVFTIICVAQIVMFFLRYLDFEFRRRKLFKDGLPHIWRALDYDPPPMGHRLKKLVRPKMGWAVAFFLATILLNCVVLATPIRPAVIAGQVVEKPTLVMFGTDWDMRERTIYGTTASYFHYTGGLITFVAVEFWVENTELETDPGDVQGLIGGYISYWVNQFKNQDITWLPMDASDAETISKLSERWYDPEFITEVQQVMTQILSGASEGRLKLTAMKITVRTDTVQSFRKWSGQ